jgi:PPOX class probable F420-dependent enzyme
MPKLTDKERDTFLAEPGCIMHIATVDATGAPLDVPIWFVYEEAQIWFTPRQHSEWLEHIRREPRVALCIDEHVTPYRKVAVRGTARIAHEVGDDDAWRDRYRRIAARYLRQDDADAYVDGTDDQPRALCAVSLSESEVRTWRMPSPGEPYDWIWAPRYWTDDAKVKQAAPEVFTKSLEK